mgnify:CR=1 FL=1
MNKTSLTYPSNIKRISNTWQAKEPSLLDPSSLRPRSHIQMTSRREETKRNST